MVSDGILLKPFIWIFTTLIGKPSLTKEQKEKAWSMFKEVLEIVIESSVRGASQQAMDQLKEKL